MIKIMNKDTIIFAYANLRLEIFPDKAKQVGAKIVYTRRSDFSDQVNNVLVFIGSFKSNLDAWVATITDNMKVAVVNAV